MKLWLHEAALALWARPSDDGGEWLPLLQHMNDSADVAGYLFDTWLAPCVVETLADELRGVGHARAGARFLAAVQGIGKACPVFAARDEVLSARLRALDLRMPHCAAGVVDRVDVHPAAIGHRLLRRWLISYGWSRPHADDWAALVAERHGRSPAPSRIHDLRAAPDVYGGGLWREVQNGLLDFQALRTGADAYLDGWARRSMNPRVRSLLIGIMTVADRIASDRRLFPHRHFDELGHQCSGQRSREALRQLRRGSPWPLTVPIQDVAPFLPAKGHTAS